MKKLVFLLIFFSSCNLAPRYTRPNQEMNAHFRLDTSHESTLKNIHWWENLEDPILNSLVMTALESNKDLQVAIYRVSAFYAHYQTVRSQLFPEISLEGFALKEELSRDADFLANNFSTIIPIFNYEFTLSYEIDLWGKLRNSSKKAFFEYLAEVETRRSVVLSLVSSVVETYILLRQLDLELEIAKATLQERKEALTFAIDRFEGGLTSEIEVVQAQSTFEETVAMVENLQRRVPQAENLLSILLGQNPHPITRGKTLLALHLPQEVASGIPSDLILARPDIRRQESKLIAANADIGVARALFLPDINITSAIGNAATKFDTIFSPMTRIWQLGGSFLQKLFTGGKLMGNLRLTEAVKKEMIYSYEQTILTALKEVNDALIGHEKAKEIVVAYKKDVTALKEYLKLSWLRYYEGQTDYLTVLDAERHLFEGELSLARAEGDQFTTLVHLYKSLGGAWIFKADEEATKESAQELKKLGPCLP